MARLKGKIKVNSSGPTLHTFKTWLSFLCSSTVAFLLIVVTLISYRLFITAKIAQIKFHRFLIFSFLKKLRHVWRPRVKFRHWVSGNNSFESLPENVLGSFTILACLIAFGLIRRVTTEILKKKTVLTTP